jgi:hypothetical protein
MADLNKIEQMLEKLVNEDRQSAEELFHEYVIEKSREIYEGLLETDLEDLEEETEEEVDEATDEEVDESEEEEVEEGFDLDEFEVAEEEPGDDFLNDIAPKMDGDEMDDEPHDEGEEEERISDLETALDDLKAEFEQLLKTVDGEEESDEDEEESDEDEEESDEEEMKDEFAFEADEEEVEESEKSETETMREYVEKVAEPKGEDNKAKSPVAGENDMGGTASNIAQGGEETGAKAETAKVEDFNQVNVPGGKASNSMKTQSAKSEGGDDNAKSTIGS